MLKFNFAFALFTAVTFLLPGLSYADYNYVPNSLYRDMINKARNTPPKFAPANPNPAANNGQAALTPSPAPTNQVAPNQAPVQYPQNNYNPNMADTGAPNQPAAQTTAPAGPPNIFITPGGGNTTNKQSGSIIHY